MAGEWEECRLGDVIELKRGFDLPRDARQRGDVPIVSSSGVSGYHQEAMVKGPGVVTGRYGTLGRVFYVVEDYWPLNTTLYVRDFKGNDPRFVSYLLQSVDFSPYSDKAAVPGLNRNHLHQASIRYPPCLAEQRAIAHILGTLDDKIELNRRMNETLEAMARALFKSWFVDFDLVRAKAEAREPGLPPHIADLFPDRFQDSEVGQIPEGWETKRLTEAIEINPGRSLEKGETAPYLDMANMPTGSARATRVYERDFTSGMRFENGDTLVARITPCLENGKTCFVDFLEPGETGWGSTEFLVFRPKPPLPKEFAYFLARSDGLRSFAISNMTGTSGRQRVPASCFGGFEIVVPPTTIAFHFGQFASGVLASIKANDEESDTLAAIRDALLPKLMSGEIRVKETDKFMEVIQNDL